MPSTFLDRQRGHHQAIGSAPHRVIPTFWPALANDSIAIYLDSVFSKKGDTRETHESRFQWGI